MKKAILIKMCSLLLAVGWTGAFAQDATSQAARQRLNLNLVDNKSTYDVTNEVNNYENSLRISQPTSDYKLTAGMLNDGDNRIAFYRGDDLGNNVECARVNLSAEVREKDSEVIDIVAFAGDGITPPSSQTTITQSMLPDNWGTNNSNLIWQTNGYAYINNVGGLTYTVPAGYSNTRIQFIIYIGTDARGGYWAYNYNDEGWAIAATASAGGVSSFVVDNVSTGDVISLLGASYNNGYSLYYSPDIELIGVLTLPLTLIPDVEVTPTVSYWDGSAWGSETAMGSATTYTVNDTINLYSLGNVTDHFSESTALNEHPNSYTYSANYNANIILPSAGSTGPSFTATADFTAATTSSPTSAAFTGPGSWEFMGASVYSPTAGICCYIQFYGSMLYVLPDNYMGNSVNVSVTTSTGEDGAGVVVVNGVSHTFRTGETYTWTVPVTANGAIEFKSDGETYSADFTRIVISSASGTKLQASSPENAQHPDVKSLDKSLKATQALPMANSKNEISSKIIVK